MRCYQAAIKPEGSNPKVCDTFSKLTDDPPKRACSSRSWSAYTRLPAPLAFGAGEPNLSVGRSASVRYAD